MQRCMIKRAQVAAKPDERFVKEMHGQMLADFQELCREQFLKVISRGAKFRWCRITQNLITLECNRFGKSRAIVDKCVELAVLTTRIDTCRQISQKFFI